MSHSQRNARIATFAYFVLNGTLMGTWVVNIPAIEKQAGISHALLGTLLMLLGLSAFVGMQVAGRLADRYGTRIIVPATGIACSVTLVLPGIAHGPWQLAGALLIFGFSNGSLDSSMNTHAVFVEKLYARPIMSSFHATFSIGGVIASLITASTSKAGLSLTITLAVIGAIGVVVSLVAAPALLDGSAAQAEPAPEHDKLSKVIKQTSKQHIWVLAILAFMVMLCEGAANDWSALGLTSVLNASESAAALGFGSFAAMMTIGRFVADRLCARFGAMAILRYGSALAAVGITIVAISPWIWMAYIGWGMFGLGLSGCVPQLFSAAGHSDPLATGKNVARVAGLGYLGMLAGPAVLGWMTHFMPLNMTFFVLTALCAISAIGAGALGNDSSKKSSTSKATD